MNYLVFMYFGVQLFVLIDKNELFNSYPAIGDIVFELTTRDQIDYDRFLELETALNQCKIKFYYKNTNGEEFKTFTKAFYKQREINLYFLQNMFLKGVKNGN